MITPIMLRSFGRSGSTLIMQVLGSSNNVLFDRDYPFEKRYLTYLCRLAYIVSKSADNDKLWNQDALINPNVLRIGPIPYKKITLFNRNNLSNEFLRKLWDVFSVQIFTKAQDSIDLSQQVYYAEKVPQDICNNINKLLPAKNLFLFRDPRDEFLSIKNFNKKRGFNGFGWNGDDTDDSFALKLCKARRGFMRRLTNIINSQTKYVVIYEKFMQSPFKETKNLGNWLEIDLNYQEVLENTQSIGHHFTSENSVFRWQNEMSPKIKDIFSSELREELLALGYDI